MVSGLERIDRLLSPAGAAAPPICRSDPDRESVGVIQDLLTGHGASGLPNLLSPQYGKFGARTAVAVAKFRAQHALGKQQEVDAPTLRALVEVPAVSPIACRAYLALVLGLPYTALTRILCVVAQMEGAGKFAALNLNTDAAGLSFGIIQWAQKPRRLSEILAAFAEALPGEFAHILGGSEPGIADALLAHTRKPNGGVDPATGKTTDPAFDLVKPPWVRRFREAALLREFQRVQVETALAAFALSLNKLKRAVPALRSERGLAFLLDLANQFGDSGVRSIHQAVYRKGMLESDLLSAMARESVRRIQAGFQKNARLRRQTFLTTGLLSDGPFDADRGKVQFA